jgi:uncharacterized protein (TIGR00369 family)
MDPLNDDFDATVRDSFARQGLNRTLGAFLVAVQPGVIHIRLPFSATLTQQNGLLHAAALTSIADNACGYAVLSLASPGCDVLAAEFTVHLLAPARAPLFEARATVARMGRTLAVAECRVFGIAEGAEELIATMTQTVFIKRPREHPA